MRVGLWAVVGGAATGIVLFLAARPATPERQAPIDGFAPAHVAAQHEVERRIAGAISTRRLAADHRFLTAEPHIAGSPRDRALAEWTRDQWIAAGLDSVEIVEHKVLLPYPRDASVEMTGPPPSRADARFGGQAVWHATLREHPDDPLAFHAYGASGDVTAPVVAAGTGAPEDFDRLAASGIDLHGKIVLVRYPARYSYRGYAVYLAQQRGAAAVLMYASHSDDVPDDAIQRGGVGFDFLEPGDPSPAARPKRTILLASWDAEEYAMTSSTEWVEQHERELREHAVAYLNVDAAVSGSTFYARAVPSLAHLVASTAGVDDAAIETRIGAGSDYTAFLNFAGVPIVDMRFQGAYPVYHSAYDTHEWVERVDAGFARHAQLTRIWATVATRLANADVLPFDDIRYAHRIGDFLTEVERRWGAPLHLASDALDRFDAAASRHADAAAAALADDNPGALDLINRALMEVEPSFIDPAGLDSRPWYRHLLFAPAFTYQPEVLPGLSEAVDSRDPKRVAEAERRLAEALDRAAACLKVFTTFPGSRAS